MKPTELHAEIANHCGEIADLFKPGVRITILVRNPNLEDADVLVTDDSIDSAIAALGKLKEKEERKLSPEDVIRNALEVQKE
jgi:hypothetical protein